MQNNFINEVIRVAPKVASMVSTPKVLTRNFNFRTTHDLSYDRNAATEASIFIHGYSAGHDSEDRKSLLSALPASTEQHTNIFAFWNSSHFTRFNQNSRELLDASAALHALSPIAAATGDRIAHFLKIRSRAEEMGRKLFIQLENHLHRDYPNVRTINLIGHSLGCRLIVSALKSLDSVHPRLAVKNVLLMAGAVEVNPCEAKAMRDLIQGRLINAYSADDLTLRLPLDEDCLGRREVEHFENVLFDGFGHTDYWKKLREVFSRTAFDQPKESSSLPIITKNPSETETPSSQSLTENPTMTLELGTPNKIYQYIDSELDHIVEALGNPSNDITLRQAQAHAIEQLAQHREKLQTHLDELEKNSEWNTFTIALYGETGAGKSTLIETLRILLQEPGKIASQQAFRELRHDLELNEETAQQLQQAIQQANAELDELLQQVTATLQLHEPSYLTAQQALAQADDQHSEKVKPLEDNLQLSAKQHTDTLATVNRLQALISERKKTLSFWQKIVRLFRKMPEEIELAQSQEKLRSVATTHADADTALSAARDKANQHRQNLAQALHDAIKVRDEAVAAIRERQAEVEQGKFVLSQQHGNIAGKMTELRAKLEKHADGEIIGDGRADFTRQTQRYDLQLKGKKFSLLDVPGIEGKEGLVLSQIQQAVQKAHAVLYVTNQAAPPQTGEGEKQRKGTLEKIKEHLGAQTEVWTIFNKKITNPKLTLGDRPLTSGDENTSLVELDKKMREQLGENYRETIPLTALPAFLASTDHLMPDSQHARRRYKMLADFSAEELLQKSRLPDLMNFFGNSLLKDSDAKITCANFNKARQVLDQAAAAVDIVHQSLTNISEKLDKDGDSAKTQLGSSFQALRQRLNARGETLIDKFSNSTRKKIYTLIDSDIKDDYFKDALKDRIMSGAEELGTLLPEALRADVETFQKEVEDIIQRFEDHAKELSEVYSQLGNIQLDGEFEFQIKLDNGINIMAMAGGLIGLALAPFTGGATLWVSGLSAIGLAASIGKAVWKFFSADYKKSQQRKATDDSLHRVSEQLRETLQASLNEALPKMEAIIGQIEEAFEAPARHAAAQAQTLAQSTRKMKALSLKVAMAGNH